MVDAEVKAWDKTAKIYFEKVVSPFSEGVKNPIYWYLDNKINVDKNKMSVIDIGCGIGNMLPTLAKQFEKVVGFDFSPKMVELSKQKVKDAKNVTVLVRDARDLTEFHNQFDVAIAVNSIILPKITDVEKMFLETHAVLKEGGILLGVFPAMEALLYRALLVQEKAMADGLSEEAAIDTVREDFKNNTPCDFEVGLVTYPDCKQKNYYLFELKYRLWKAGFNTITIRKVHYPWEVYEDDTLMAFQGKQKLWDWFVYARK